MKLKVNFDNQRLTITSKKFNPFNFSFYGIDVKTEKTENQVDPFRILENLAGVRSTGENNTVIDNLRAMQSLINK